MLKPEFTGQFKKDYKLAVKRGCDPQKLKLQGHERVSHSAGLATGV